MSSADPSAHLGQKGFHLRHKLASFEMNCLGDAATGATYGAGIGALLEGMAVSFDESLLRVSSCGNKCGRAVGTRGGGKGRVRFCG